MWLIPNEELNAGEKPLRYIPSRERKPGDHAVFEPAFDALWLTMRDIIFRYNPYYDDGSKTHIAVASPLITGLIETPQTILDSPDLKDVALDKTNFHGPPERCTKSDLEPVSNDHLGLLQFLRKIRNHNLRVAEMKQQVLLHSQTTWPRELTREALNLIFALLRETSVASDPDMYLREQEALLARIDEMVLADLGHFPAGYWRTQGTTLDQIEQQHRAERTGYPLLNDRDMAPDTTAHEHEPPKPSKD